MKRRPLTTACETPEPTIITSAPDATATPTAVRISIGTQDATISDTPLLSKSHVGSLRLVASWYHDSAELWLLEPPATEPLAAEPPATTATSRCSPRTAGFIAW